MNNVQDIQKMVNSLCPNGVKFVTLGEVASAKTGDQLNKTLLTTSGEYEVMNGGINPSGYHSEYNTTSNTIAISQGGASAGYVNFMTRNFWAGAHCYVVVPSTPEVDNKYLYYYLKSQQDKIQQSKLGAGIPGLNRSTLMSVQIPIPPIEIQVEIARTLDTFTALEAALEEELEARKKQYDYYRNQLLTFRQGGGPVDSDG